MLIHSGDFMHAGEDAAAELRPFVAWLAAQPFAHKIVVAGNHDRLLDTAFFGAHGRLPRASLRAKRELCAACTYLEVTADNVFRSARAARWRGPGGTSGAWQKKKGEFRPARVSGARSRGGGDPSAPRART